MKKYGRLRHVATATLGATAAATVGAVATDPNGTWYKNLDKPDWNPPNWIFPVVWTSLYADIGVVTGLTAAQLEREGRSQEQKSYKRAVRANLILNGSWPPSFFQLHNLPVATAWCAVVALSSADLVRRTWKVDRKKGLALTPYAAWMGLATTLSAQLMLRNRS